jgi:hypothetical protein
MRGGIRRRAAQLVLLTVAAPLVAWALERGAQRAEARDATSRASRWLRQGADTAQRVGRGPLARRLRPPETGMRG